MKFFKGLKTAIPISLVLWGLIFLCAYLLSGCSNIGLLKADQMEKPEIYHLSLSIVFTPAGLPILDSPIGASGRTFCNPPNNAELIFNKSEPVVVIKGYKHKGKILPEDVFAIGFEILNSLHCRYPDQFVNVEKLPDGWGVY